MRPRFRVPIEGEAERARRQIQRAIAESSWVRGGLVGQRLELTVPERERHYWSPHLSVVIEEEEDGQTVLEGRFGPHPHVWTMFIALYAHVGFIGIGGAMYGASQWILGQDPWALWGVPLAAALGLLVYLAAFYGQGLGGEQMYRLRSFVEQAMTPDGVAPQDARG